MSRPVALLDANVLYPARLRDLLIRLNIGGLYQARWSDQILDECFRNILEDRPELSADRLDRTRQNMIAALPDATVSDYAELVVEQDLPDPDDRHVLAAALKTGAEFLVTNNLDDFPADKVPTHLRVMSPDEFVAMLAETDMETIVEVIEAQAADLTNPPITAGQVLDGLEVVGLVETVAQLRLEID